MATSTRRTARRARNDRHKVAPGYGQSVVSSLEVFSRRGEALTIEDARAVTQQLGYLPLNIICVGAFGTDGAPLVAQLYPLLANQLGGRYDSEGIYIPHPRLQKQSRGGTNNNGTETPGERYSFGGNDEDEELEQAHRNEDANGDGDDDGGGKGNDEGKEEQQQEEEPCKGKPFPTLLWLTHPGLHAAICKLEDSGWIQRLDERLKASPEDLHKMHAAHEAYARTRYALLSPEDEASLERAGWADAIRSTGIAGMHNFDSVKCLHCHTAHHLARPEDGNIIGEWVRELLHAPGEAWHFDLPPP